MLIKLDSWNGTCISLMEIQTLPMGSLTKYMKSNTNFLLIMYFREIRELRSKATFGPHHWTISDLLYDSIIYSLIY